MRVLGVVLFAVLLCFVNSAFGQTDCNGNGLIVDTAAGLCVCDSGYSGATCQDALDVVSCEAKEVDPIVATFFPKLNTTDGATTFTHNHLKATILNPQVEGRRFTALYFLGAQNGANACKFGTVGSFWGKETFTGADAASCGDRFTLDMPWASHVACGFAPVADESNENKLKIQGQLMIKYEDTLDIEGENLTRIVSVPYKMAVTFPRTINVTLLTLNITSDVHYGVALTGDEFEPNNQTLTLQLTTIINFPNTFHMYYTEFYHPEHVYAIQGNIPGEGRMVYVVPEKTLSTPECYLNSGACTQRWNIQLKINETYVATHEDKNCTFDGNYTVQYRLYTCRGISGNADELECTYSLTNVSFSIATSDICGAIDVHPTVKGKLLAIPASHHFEEFDNFEAIRSQAKTRFALGQFAKFYADIQSDGNDITIVFEEIKMIKRTAEFPAPQAVPDDATWTIMYDRATPANVVHPYMLNARVNVSHEHKGFEIYFHSSVFSVAPEATEAFVISATATITFLGNDENPTRKRTIEYTFEQNSARANANVGLSNGAVKPDNVVTPAAPGVNQLTFIASVVGAVAGTLIIVFVVVGVVLRSRNNEARDSAASPAVSAANAAASSLEVMNRA